MRMHEQLPISKQEEVIQKQKNSTLLVCKKLPLKNSGSGNVQAGGQLYSALDAYSLMFKVKLFIITITLHINPLDYLASVSVK
jgi:hypothetical protein